MRFFILSLVNYLQYKLLDADEIAFGLILTINYFSTIVL